MKISKTNLKSLEALIHEFHKDDLLSLEEMQTFIVEALSINLVNIISEGVPLIERANYIHYTLRRTNSLFTLLKKL